MSKQKTLNSEISEEIPNVKCEICGKEFQKITNSHLKKHDITINEYMEQFPDAFLITESCRKKFSGENNGMYGKHQSEESKQKSREAHLGKISSLRGRHLTKEHKQKLREVNLGKKASEDTKQLMSDNHVGMKGKCHTEEAKQKMRKPRSEEGKKNMRKPKSEEHKQKLREYRLGKKASEEAKQKMSKSCSGENNPMFGRTGEKCPMYGRTGEQCPAYGRTGEKHPMYKGGISFFPYCEKFDNDLKERVRDFFGRCCYVCGKNEIENGQRLSVHHVNYNKMVCCNDVKPLFVPLCRSCHAKTSGDCEYWEEFFTVSLNYLTNGECFIPKEVNKN